MKTLAAISTCAVMAAACYGGGGDAARAPDPLTTPKSDAPYLRDAGFRRATLEASLVNPDNGYSKLRLASYETGKPGDWARLPEWNPRVEPVAVGALDDEGGLDMGAPFGADARALAISGDAAAADEAALVALGEQAFFRYPATLAPPAAVLAASRESFERYGFWIDEARGAGGLVRAEMADGSRALAYTCSTCHAASHDGALVLGLGNDRLDLGRIAYDYATRTQPPSDELARYLTWGPGRNDVTTTNATEPVKMADLRPARWLTHLQADGSVAQKDRATLAVRIETLIITTHGAVLRPPRAVALGLAAYIWSLADALPTERALSADEAHGARVFQSTCARCHAQPALTGPPVPLDVVGTDPTIGLSTERGTGAYRVPSLHGVSSRRALLHDASLPSLTVMFDPARLRPDFTGGRHGPGPVAGHLFGLDLGESDRAALLAYLASL